MTNLPLKILDISFSRFSPSVIFGFLFQRISPPSSSRLPYSHHHSISPTTMATSTSSSLSFFSSTLFSSSKTKHHFSLKPTLKFPSLPQSHSPLSLSVKSQLTTLPVLNFAGEVTGETYLDLKTAPPETARAVVHRALVTNLQNKRRGTASTLTRAEVRGGGKKPYPQKSTGRARRGSQRSPLRPGGGVIFGPKPRDWTVKLNKKERRLALSTAIANAAESAAVVVEEFGDKFERPKTKDFIAAMKRWGVDPSEKSMFLVTELQENVEKSGRNIGSLKLLTPRSLNLYDVLNSDKLVFTKGAVDYLNQMYGVDTVEDDDDDEGEDGEGEEGFEPFDDGSEEDGTPEAAE